MTDVDKKRIKTVIEIAQALHESLRSVSAGFVQNMVDTVILQRTHLRRGRD